MNTKIKIIVSSLLFLNALNCAEIKEAAAQYSDLLREADRPIIPGASEIISPQNLAALINNAININQQTNSGMTALHFAVINSKEDFIAQLLKRADLDLNIDDNDCFTPIHLAVKENKINIVRMLITDKRIDKFKLNQRAYKNKKVRDAELRKLMGKERTQAVCHVITHGGLTPLMTAALQNNEPMVNLLLEHDANPCLMGIANPEIYLKEPSEKLVTHLEKDFPQFKAMVEKIQIYNLWGKKLFEIITDNNLKLKYESINNLLSNYLVNVNFMDTFNNNYQSSLSAIIKSSENEKEKEAIIKLLLKYAANPNNLTEKPTLAMANYYGASSNLIKFLLDAGADTMHSLINIGYFQDINFNANLANLLIKYGATNEFGNYFKHDLYSKAISKGDWKVIDFLIKNRVDSNIRNPETSQTPLDYALTLSLKQNDQDSVKIYKRIICLLLEAKAEINTSVGFNGNPENFRVTLREESCYYPNCGFSGYCSGVINAFCCWLTCCWCWNCCCDGNDCVRVGKDWTLEEK